MLYLGIKYDFNYKHKINIYILLVNKAKEDDRIEKSHTLKIMIFLKFLNNMSYIYNAQNRVRIQFKRDILNYLKWVKSNHEQKWILN